VAIERTFAIIKPDAVGRGLQGEISLAHSQGGIQDCGRQVDAADEEEAGGFYAVHQARPFFGELTDFMSSGKIFALVLEADGAITKWRDHDGRHRSKKATPGLFATTSAPTSATTARTVGRAGPPRRFEIGYFFSGLELI